MSTQTDLPKRFVVQKGKKFYTRTDDNENVFKYSILDKAEVMNREDWPDGIDLDPNEKVVEVIGRAGKSLRIKEKN